MVIRMRIGIVGCGFIGRTIGGALEQMEEIDEIPAIDMDYDSVVEMGSRLDKVSMFRIDHLDDFLERSDLVVEAASQEAVAEIGPKVLEMGKNLMIMSVGALVNDDLWSDLRRIAVDKGCHVYIPSGAIAGLDGIYAGSMADIDCVTLTVTKPPKGLSLPSSLHDKISNLARLKEPLTVFDGTAREAVAIFPKNVNVAASIALAGIGFDRTRVKIIADPSVSRNRHRVEIRGRFGEMSVRMMNLPSDSNPRTSYIAPLSAIATIRKIMKGIYIGT
jgi:aspartate dehydrogenase